MAVFSRINATAVDTNTVLLRLDRATSAERRAATSAFYEFYRTNAFIGFADAHSIGAMRGCQRQRTRAFGGGVEKTAGRYLRTHERTTFRTVSDGGTLYLASREWGFEERFASSRCRSGTAAN